MRKWTEKQKAAQARRWDLPENWLSVKEVARRLERSEATIYNYIAIGHLPAQPHGPYEKAIHRDDLIRFRYRADLGPFSADDVAVICGVSAPTVRAACRKGLLSPVSEHPLRFDAEEISCYRLILDKQEQEQAARQAKRNKPKLSGPALHRRRSEAMKRSWWGGGHRQAASDPEKRAQRAERTRQRHEADPELVVRMRAGRYKNHPMAPPLHEQYERDEWGQRVRLSQKMVDFYYKVRACEEEQKRVNVAVKDTARCQRRLERAQEAIHRSLNRDPRGRATTPEIMQRRSDALAEAQAALAQAQMALAAAEHREGLAREQLRYSNEQLQGETKTETGE